MQTSILALGKAYLNTYKGLPVLAYRGVYVSLIESIFIGVFYFLSIYFVKELHFNVASAGMIISFYGVGAILGGYLGGRLSDATSPSGVMIVSMIVQSAGYFLLAHSTTMMPLSCIVFLLGVAGYSFITANYLWVLSECQQENERLKAINLLSTSSNLGLGISAMIISTFSPHYFNYIFETTACILLVLAAWVYFLENKKAIKGIVNSVITSDNAEKIGNAEQTRWKIPATLICVLLVGAVVAQISSTYPIYIQTRFSSMGMQAIGILFALNSFLVVLLEVPLGNWVKSANKMKMVGVGSALIGVGMSMLAFAQTYMIAIIACVTYTIGEIFFFCMAQLVCYQEGRAHRKGKSLGLFRTTYAMSRVLGPFAGGLVYYHFGGNMVWYLSGVIGIACLMLCLQVSLKEVNRQSLVT